jgi:oxygen-independent coproporphyrinogen-3 oxidase
MALAPKLTRKYNQPVPRYTSYPTVPFWENKIDQESWKKTIKTAFDQFGICVWG